MNVTCGPSSDGAFGWYDHGTSSWRTYRRLRDGRGYSEKYLATYPHSGSMRNGMLYPLARWVPHTCDDVCSSWPTPVAKDDGKSPAQHLSSKREMDRRRISAFPVFMRYKAGVEHGYVNPRWVLWLMGFPSDWFDHLMPPSGTQ